MHKFKLFYYIFSVIFSLNSLKASDLFTIDRDVKTTLTSPKISLIDSPHNPWTGVIQYDEAREMMYAGELLSISPKNGTFENNLNLISRDKTSVVFSASKDIEEDNSAEEKLLGEDIGPNENYALRDFNFAHKYKKSLRAQDDRILVEAHSSYPNYCHGHLLMDFGNGSKYFGSATLIDRKTILTAAHNLYDRISKKAVESVIFYAGKNLRAVVARGYSEKVIIPLEWTEEIGANAYNYDFGVVILKESFGQRFDSAPLTYLGIYPLNDEEFLRKKLTVTGYPGIIYNRLNQIEFVSGNFMYEHSGDTVRVDPEQICYEIDTSAGQSGSAVWFSEEIENEKKELVTRYFCCGVHSRSGPGQTKYNVGTRITENKSKLISDWINAHSSVLD